MLNLDNMIAVAGKRQQELQAIIDLGQQLKNQLAALPATQRVELTSAVVSSLASEVLPVTKVSVVAAKPPTKAPAVKQAAKASPPISLKQLSLRDCAVTVFKENPGKAMRVADVLAIAKRRGFVGTAHADTHLGYVLGQTPTLFKRVSRGLYTLRS